MTCGPDRCVHMQCQELQTFQSNAFMRVPNTLQQGGIHRLTAGKTISSMIKIGIQAALLACKKYLSHVYDEHFLSKLSPQVK